MSTRPRPDEGDAPDPSRSGRPASALPAPVDLPGMLRSPWTALGLAALLFVAGAQTAAWTGYGAGNGDEADRLAARADSALELRRDLSFYRFQSDRLQAIVEKSADYRVPADVARDIYDTAREVGLDPEIAFRMVEIESSFRRRAVSSAGAVGFTQIKPSTARWLNPNVSREDLFEPRTNLRLGFRYLRVLLDRYDGNVRLALLAYNRGPTRVGADLAMGRDPSNGYARSVMAVGKPR